MCVYSYGDNDTVRAEVGHNPVVSNFSHGNRWFAHPVNDRPVCVKEGTTLFISNVPQDMQQRFGLGPSERLICREGSRNAATGDQFITRHGDRLTIRDLPVGTRVLVQSLTPLPLVPVDENGDELMQADPAETEVTVEMPVEVLVEVSTSVGQPAVAENARRIRVSELPIHISLP